MLTDVTPRMQIFTEETFGPVAPLIRFKTEDEVIGLANDTRVRPRGVLLQPRHRPHLARRPRRSNYGMVGVNAGIISTEVAPFGGVKQSGLGREGSSTASRNISR